MIKETRAGVVRISDTVFEVRTMFPHFVNRGLAANRFARIVALLAVGAGIHSNVAAGDQPRFSTAKNGSSDVMLARSALAALDGDLQTRDVPIVISVVDRVAVIGGSVPTPEHGKRVESIVRNVTGIQDVKNRCFVQSQPDPLIRAVADRLNPMANRQPLAQNLPGMVPLPRPMRPEEYAIPATAVVVAKPPAPTPVPVKTLKIESSTPLRPNLLMEPVTAPTGPRAPAVPPAKLTNTSTGINVPVSVPTRPADLFATLAAIRKTEARFAGLTFEVRDGVVSLSGSSPRDSDAWDFADVVRRVPGVNQVVVGRINVR